MGDGEPFPVARAAWGVFDRYAAPELTIEAQAIGDPLQAIADLLRSGGFADIDVAAIRSVRLFYVRQVSDTAKDAVIPYFTPEFSYLVDLGQPRLALVAVPYIVPMLDTPDGKRPAGHGDPHFPRFAEARVFSAKGDAQNELLYPAKAGELLIKSKDDVTKDQLSEALAAELRESLQPVSQGLYIGRVDAFREDDVRERISAVPAVAYAELNSLARNIDLPWLVDRVL